MGPKTFVACYVCFKEFGSKSIPFHEPKCLERWRASNKKLPVEKRTPTPVKPVGWKYSQDSTWVCSHCQVSVPAAKRGVHAAVCFAELPKSESLSNKKGPSQNNLMTGVVKSDFSPKKGKENKNISNRIPTPTVSKKNAKNEAKVEAKSVKSEVVSEGSPQKHGAKSKLCTESPKNKVNDKVSEETQKSEEDNVSSTSKRSIRPQTKILRRPTPNLKHPVIQVDSDDSSGDSSSSDKGKDDNPKRLKMGSENPDSAHKPKNFVMYNKYNVEKNTKNCPKEKSSERSSATAIPSIPNPCNSCNRSQAPERLHSHAKRDSRGLMFRKSPPVDVKMASPQKKVLDTIEKNKLQRKERDTVQVEEGDKNERRSRSIKTTSIETKTEFADITSPEKSSITEPPTPTKSSIELVKPCYICHEEFKVSSLLLHESKCLENWKKTNNSLTPNLRKLPPRRPDEAEIRTPNEDDPAWSAVQSQLVPCPVCGRTFFPERLPVHRRVCKGKSSPRPLKRASSLREQSASSRDGEDQRSAPVYVPCYVCGRSYGSWVISMHEQQCLRKWRRENDKLPDCQQQEEPIKSPGSSADDDIASLIELGDTAWESHLQQLVPCPRCSRTFFPDRLEVHERSCKGPSCSRRPRSNKGA